MQKDKPRLSFEIGAKSIPGTMHEWQDRIHVDRRRLIFAVADGVSGNLTPENNGAVAAQTLLSLLRADPTFYSDLPKTIEKANQDMMGLRAADDTIGGTTITAARIADGFLHVANVGDSPAYLVRRNRITQLHSRDTGVFGGLEQWVMKDGGLRVHKRRVALQPEDLIVIASDGIVRPIRSLIWNPDSSVKRDDIRILVSVKEILGAVQSSQTIQDAVLALLNLIAVKKSYTGDDMSMIMIKAIARD